MCLPCPRLARRRPHSRLGVARFCLIATSTWLTSAKSGLLSAKLGLFATIPTTVEWVFMTVALTPLEVQLISASFRLVSTNMSLATIGLDDLFATSRCAPLSHWHGAWSGEDCDNAMSCLVCFSNHVLSLRQMSCMEIACRRSFPSGSAGLEGCDMQRNDAWPLVARVRPRAPSFVARPSRPGPGAGGTIPCRHSWMRIVLGPIGHDTTSG